MSGVRDPAFWKRFSYAVHMDEEFGNQGQALKQKDTWLARQHKKKASRTYVCCAFWGTFIAFVIGVVIVIIWLLKSGILNKIDGNSPEQSTSANSTATVDTSRLVRLLLE